MAESKAARRYAKALFELAQEGGSVEAVRDDCAALAGLLADSAEFAAFVENPVIAADRQRAILASLFQGKADPLTFRFLQFLTQKDRLDQLAGICEVVEAMYDDLKGILKAQILSAKPLSDSEVTAIKAKLKARMSKDIETTESVDPSLLGGFKIIVDDLVLDHTLQIQLDRYRDAVITA